MVGHGIEEHAVHVKQDGTGTEIRKSRALLISGNGYNLTGGCGGSRC